MATSIVALNFRQKRPQHSWTQEERLVLCCLRRFFVLGYGEITKIFNDLYGLKISSEGFPDGLKKSTLTIQWEDLKRKVHNDWELVHRQIPFEQGPTYFSHLFEKIRASSQRVHIGLVARARDLDIPRIERSVGTRKRPPRPLANGQRLHLNARPPMTGNEPQPSHQVNATQENQSRPTETPRVPVPSEGRVISDPIQHIRSYGLNRRDEFPTPVKPTHIPSLLFRFSNDESSGINTRYGYIAYAFTSELGNIPHPEERLQEFPAWVWTHVNKKRIPSPFISTSIDPLIPIHRALKANTNAIVSIIDTSQIQSNHIFWMRDMMKQFSIRTIGYYGSKEYIIWGFIARNAILTSFKIDDLLTIANQHPDIASALQLDKISDMRNCKQKMYDEIAKKSFENDLIVGKTIGKLLKLLRVQRDYIDDVALALNGSWSFTSGDTAEFLHGVHEGYDTTAGAAPDSSPPSTNASNAESIDSTDLNIAAQEDYVMVGRFQQNCNNDNHGEHATEASRVRESIERLSIFDAEDDDSMVVISNTPCPTPVAEKGKEVVRSTEKRPAAQQLHTEAKIRKTDNVPFPGRKRTVATRQISVFNPGSASWSPFRELPSSEVEKTDIKEEPLPSIESIPSSHQDLRAPPMATQEDRDQQLNLPVTPQHSRASSLASESTIRNETPASDRFGAERSRINRVLEYDWDAFWDSLQSSAES